MIVFKEGGQNHFDLVVVVTRGDVRVCSPRSRTVTNDETRLKEAQIRSNPCRCDGFYAHLDTGIMDPSAKSKICMETIPIQCCAKV